MPRQAMALLQVQKQCPLSRSSGPLRTTPPATAEPCLLETLPCCLHQISLVPSPDGKQAAYAEAVSFRLAENCIVNTCAAMQCPLHWKACTNGPLLPSYLQVLNAIAGSGDVGSLTSVICKAIVKGAAAPQCKRLAYDVVRAGGLADSDWDDVVEGLKVDIGSGVNPEVRCNMSNFPVLVS